MSTADGQVVGATRILDNGPVEDRWNLVLMSEGYTSEEVGPMSSGHFSRDAETIVDQMLATPPFDRLRRAINVFRVDVISDEAGADNLCVTPPTTVRTYFDAVQCPDGIARRIDINTNTAQAVATAEVPRFNAALVVVNTADYGGSGGRVAVCSLHPLAHHIALHEIGHSAFLLADEYQALLGCDVDEGHEHNPATVEPEQPNVTLDPQARGKWRDLVATTTPMPTTRNPDCAHCDERPSPVPDGTIGAFEGAHYYHCGSYRPAYNCRMGNRVEHDFCGVCQRVIARRLAAHMPETNVVAAMLVDPAARNDFRTTVASGDFIAAMSAVVRFPHWLGMLMFTRDESAPTSPHMVTEIRQRRLASFPSPAFAHATYFSRAGDSSAGTTAVRDARRLVASVACTSAPATAGSAAALSFDVGDAVFDVARAAGVTERDILALDLDFAPVRVDILGTTNLALFREYGKKVAAGDHVGAIGSILQDHHPLGLVVFEGESDRTIPPEALASVGANWVALLPPPPPGVVTFPQYFFRTGDPAAGTPPVRDARLHRIHSATTTLSGGGGSKPGIDVHEVEPRFFELVKAAGEPEADVIVVVGPSIIF